MRDDCTVVVTNDEAAVFEQLSHINTIEKHLILDLHKLGVLSEECIINCIQASAFLNGRSLSLVLIVSEKNILELPDSLSVAPTLVEAVDVVELEVMERDLGF
jgi:hypothetical protein